MAVCALVFLASGAAPSLQAQQVSQQDSIHLLEQSIEEYNRLIDEVFAELEALKLRRIAGEIRRIGLPAGPAGEEVVHHGAFSLGYNEQHEQAGWVAHIVTKDVLYGTVGRTNDFRPDTAISTGTSDVDDFWDSGYDRGHLAPSADFRWSRTALSKSYLYSNISPQRPELNRESWARLENLVREFAVDAGEVFVVTGPVLHDGLPKIPQGSRRVSIPGYFYKVVADLSGDEIRGIAFVLPNGRASDRLIDYAVSIDSVEVLTGIDFFPALDSVAQAFLEGPESMNRWPVTPTVLSGSPAPVAVGKGQVTPAQAKYYTGDTATVCGTVVSARFNQNGKANPTYLNLDRKFPDHVFTVVIFGKDRMNFTYAPEEYLSNRKICVTGRVEEWNGVPQIIVDRQESIEVLED